MPELIKKEVLLNEMRGMVYNGQNADEIYEDFETLISEQQTVTENDIRNKAIDVFAEKIKYEIRNCSWQFSRLEESTIDEIARKLKEE